MLHMYYILVLFPISGKVQLTFFKIQWNILYKSYVSIILSETRDYNLLQEVYLIRLDILTCGRAQTAAVTHAEVSIILTRCEASITRNGYTTAQYRSRLMQIIISELRQRPKARENMTALPESRKSKSVVLLD